MQMKYNYDVMTQIYSCDVIFCDEVLFASGEINFLNNIGKEERDKEQDREREKLWEKEREWRRKKENNFVVVKI